MIELTLPDMTCGHCVKAVTQAVKAVDDQAQVSVDLNAHRVRIESTAAPERLRAALVEQGYTPA